MDPDSPEPTVDALTAIERLVSFPTESARSNLDLVGWIEGALRRVGAEPAILPNSTGDKAALFASFGPRTDGGVLLSGHTDVVPASGQEWTGDPFRLRIGEGRLYGRGACDMKGFIGCVVAMAPRFMSAGLKRPIHVLFTYDEETTCLGPVDAIARFGSQLPRPGCVIVGEPTRMRVVTSHRSVAAYVTRVLGKEAHSSAPEAGLSAIRAAADLMAEIFRIGDEGGRVSKQAGSSGWSTNVGRVGGGTARNVVAGECSFEWEYRAEPDRPQDFALRRLESFVRGAAPPELRSLFKKVQIDTRCEVAVPGLRPVPDQEAESLARRLSGSCDCASVSFATEAGRFQQAGLPAVICGPGDIAQAHQPDEYVEVGQITACLRFLDDLASEFSAD